MLRYVKIPWFEPVLDRFGVPDCFFHPPKARVAHLGKGHPNVGVPLPSLLGSNQLPQGSQIHIYWAIGIKTQWIYHSLCIWSIWKTFRLVWMLLPHEINVHSKNLRKTAYKFHFQGKKGFRGSKTDTDLHELGVFGLKKWLFIILNQLPYHFHHKSFFGLVTHNMRFGGATFFDFFGRGPRLAGSVSRAGGGAGHQKYARWNPEIIGFPSTMHMGRVIGQPRAAISPPSWSGQ